MKHKNPEHCKGCLSYRDGGKKDGKHNRWCCHFGKPALKAIGHCKNVDGKVITQ